MGGELEDCSSHHHGNYHTHLVEVLRFDLITNIHMYLKLQHNHTNYKF